VAALLGGILPQPPYLSGGQRRGFTFGLPAHRSFLGTSKFMIEAKKKKKGALYPRPRNAEALRLRTVILTRYVLADRNTCPSGYRT
jgi:hypothetical protein